MEPKAYTKQIQRVCERLLELSEQISQQREAEEVKLLSLQILEITRFLSSMATTSTHTYTVTTTVETVTKTEKVTTESVALPQAPLNVSFPVQKQQLLSPSRTLQTIPTPAPHTGSSFCSSPFPQALPQQQQTSGTKRTSSVDLEEPQKRPREEAWDEEIDRRNTLAPLSEPLTKMQGQSTSISPHFPSTKSGMRRVSLQTPHCLHSPSLTIEQFSSIPPYNETTNEEGRTQTEKSCANGRSSNSGMKCSVLSLLN